MNWTTQYSRMHIACCGLKCKWRHFCESCLKYCPHCRTAGKAFSHVINKGLRSEINQLKIICSNHAKGCLWTGELGALKIHLESDKGCGFVEVNCPNRCCTDQMTLSQHQFYKTIQSGILLLNVAFNNTSVSTVVTKTLTTRLQAEVLQAKVSQSCCPASHSLCMFQN